MTTREINALLTLRGETVKDAANAIGEDADMLSATINYLRVNKRIREKFAAHIGMVVEKVFGDEGQPLPGKSAREATHV